MVEPYLTVAARTRVEIEKVRGSRFLATLEAARDRREAGARVAAIRAEFPDARHHGYAWRLGPDGGDWYFCDDGEPAGSTGRPILQQLERKDLTDCVLVVTRWFGGTKLGVGGLVRAYGAAARAAVEAAPLRRVVPSRRVAIRFPYACSGAVEALLAADQLRPAAAEYGPTVRLELDVPLARLDAFLAELRERTAGHALVEPPG